MHVTFHGAIREVNYSIHQPLSIPKKKIVADSRIHCGYKEGVTPQKGLFSIDLTTFTDATIPHVCIDYSAPLSLFSYNNFAGRKTAADIFQIIRGKQLSDFSGGKQLTSNSVNNTLFQNILVMNN